MSRVQRFFVSSALVVVAGCELSEPATAPPRSLAPRTLVATVFTVSNTNDAGSGSLRQAIAAALPGDVIQFNMSLAAQTITLTSGELTIDKALTIEGPATGIVLSAGGASRVLRVAVTGDAKLRNVTITGGVAPDGGAGGGIMNLGTLTLEHSTVSGNAINWSGAGAEGGGIYSENNSVLTLVNSTVSGNQSHSNGGGIKSRGALLLTHTTIAFNTTTGGTGGGFDAGQGSIEMKNSIIANNASFTGDDNCRFFNTVTVTLLGKSVVGTFGCPTNATVIVDDPLLAPLASNGGPTKTHALLIGSPAIDAAIDCTLPVDQRYVARQGPACDIGAHEFDYFKTPISIDATVAVNPTNGVAIVTGKVMCSQPSVVAIHVELTQSQKNGRSTVVAKAASDVGVNCITVKAWSISLAPPTGAFQNNAGSVTATTINVPAWTSPASSTAAVKLYWAHK